jgi:two-component sensor histidine kinase
LGAKHFNPASLSVSKGDLELPTTDKVSAITLVVGDNGVRIPVWVEFKNKSFLGLQLVNSLVKQIEGTIELDRSYGTSFRILV